MPPGSEGTVNPPSLAEMVLNSAPVPLFLILTSAPGITPPDVSTTVPDSDVKKLPCARATLAAGRVTMRTAVNNRKNLNVIECSLLQKEPAVWGKNVSFLSQTDQPKRAQKETRSRLTRCSIHETVLRRGQPIVSDSGRGGRDPSFS